MLGAGDAAARPCGRFVRPERRSRSGPGRRRADPALEFGVAYTADPAPAELLVNATSVGLEPGDTLDGLPLVEAATVVDLVYGGGPTPFER